MNTQLALAPSAARTASFLTADISNTEDYRSAIFVIDVTAYPEAASVSPIIQGKSLLSGSTYNILISTAITSTGTTILHVGDGTTDVNNVAVGTRLPRVWRLFVFHANTDPITYSVGVDLSTGPTRVRTQ